MTRKKRKAAYHHGNLRAALIECGLELIQEKGMRALTLREIGSRLGVSRSAAYRHFADKAALLAAISEAGFVEFGDALEAAKHAAGEDFGPRLEAMGIAYVRFAWQRRAHFEVMFSEPPQPDCPPSEAGLRAFGILEQTIREGQQTGEVRAGDSKLLARAVWAFVHGVAMLRMDEGAEPNFMQFGADVLTRGVENRNRVRVSPETAPSVPANR